MVGVLYMKVSVQLCLLTTKSINTGLLLKFDHLYFVTCEFKQVLRKKWGQV